jgi:hypothetical protein
MTTKVLLTIFNLFHDDPNLNTMGNSMQLDRRRAIVSPFFAPNDFRAAPKFLEARGQRCKHFYGCNLRL